MSISVINRGTFIGTTIVDVPVVSVEDKYKYDGTAKGPTIASLDTENTVVTGATATEAGEYTMTISLADAEDMVWSDLTTAPKTYSYRIVNTTIYGVYWDGTSSPAMTRTDAAELFTDPVPAVNNGSGSSPFDDCMPWSGMERVTDSEAGVLVKIPKFWYKWTRSGTTMKLQIADGEVDGFYVSPAHADRGDGKGERDYVYVGAYHCSTNDYKSTTGVKPKVSITRETARSSISALGSTIWQWDYAMLWTIRMLYLVEYAHWDSQAKIGYGCGNGSATENSGLCDAMTYHTGTNASSQTTYGHVRYRWIEDLWANVYDWCDGIYFSSATIYGIKNPASFSDSSGGTNIGTRATSSGDITQWTSPTASGFEYALYPSAVSGTDHTIYCCDRCSYNSSAPCLYVGGYHSFQSRNFGLFYSYSYGTSNSNTNIGSRLQKLP